MRISFLFALLGTLMATGPARAADILWASLVSDTDPAMPDQGFIDLLTGVGHNVTRFEIEATQAPLDAAEVATLNMADLVILGRGNASGNFQDLDADPWNQEVTAPVLVMSAYLIRTNRMGWMMGDAVPDSGPSPLVAADPDHPIFDGITFGADGVTMTEEFNIMIDRGTTIMGNAPVAGGIAIATHPTIAGGVAIAEWPTGTTVTPLNATAAPLAGPRNFFAGGSREADGGSVQDTAGQYDLTAAGQMLFLNTINYILDVEPPLIGDFNDDGEVTEEDYFILNDNLGGHLDGPVGVAQGDINFDGQVDLDDFGQFKEMFPAAVAQALGIPEPASMTLACCALAALALGLRRRKGAL
jgi:hypothetical protein